MKTKLKHIALLACAVSLLSSCNNYEWDANHTTHLTALDVATSDQEKNMTINYRDSTTNEGETISMEWNKVKAEDHTLVFYEVLFYTNDALDKPFYIYQTKGNQLENFLKISEKELNVIAERAGIHQKESGEIKWKVRASNGPNEIFSEGYKSIKISRPNGFARFPNDIHVLGTAANAEMTKDAVPLKKMVERVKGPTAEMVSVFKGEYNGFVYLVDGEFTLIEKMEKGYDYRRFKITDDNKLIEILKGDQDVKNTAISKDKLHRININFKNQTAKVSKVEAVELWYSGTESVLGTFSQVDDKAPVWTLTTYVELVKANTGLVDYRYKFRARELDKDGVSTYVYWGYEDYASKSQIGSTVSDTPWYFYMYQVDDSRSGYCYRFNDKNLHDKKTLRFRIDMRSTIDYYTHSVEEVKID